ncbi:hypothetical protein [Rheinheimera texasensis]
MQAALHRYAKHHKNAGKSAALAKEAALESQRPKSAGESVDSLFSEH